VRNQPERFFRPQIFLPEVMLVLNFLLRSWLRSGLDAQFEVALLAVEGFASVGVAIRACGEIGFRLGAEAEIGRGRFANGPSAVLSIEFQHAVGGGCAVRDLGFRFFAHVLPSSSGRPPCAFAECSTGWW
jgi:hypothetical protein